MITTEPPWTVSLAACSRESILWMGDVSGTGLVGGVGLAPDSRVGSLSVRVPRTINGWLRLAGRSVLVVEISVVICRFSPINRRFEVAGICRSMRESADGFDPVTGPPPVDAVARTGEPGIASSGRTGRVS